MARIVVIDTGALIGLVNAHDAHHEWARSLFVDTVDAKWLMSALSYAELLVHPARAGLTERFEAQLQGLHLEVRDVDAQQARDIALLRASTGMKMPDVVVLHLARSIGALLATTDSVLATRAMARGVDVLWPGHTPPSRDHLLTS